MGRNKVRTALLVSAGAALILAVFLLSPVDRERAKGLKSLTRKIYDRNNVLMREMTSSEYFVSSWTPIDSMPDFTLKCFVEKEDKRFYSHPGIDFFSLGRAVIQNFKGKRVVSGASTITMQSARLIYHLNQPQIVRKILEVLYALKLEIHLTKREILEIYLNRSHFGNSIYGISSASKAYFSKSSSALSLKESALLAVTLQAPSIYNPVRNSNAEKMAESLLKLMAQRGEIGSVEYEMALGEPVSVGMSKMKFLSPHFCDRVVYELGTERWVKAFTSADCAMQEELEEIMKTSLSPLAKMNLTNGAMMIADGKTGDVLVMIGSEDYFSEEIDGQYNACYGFRCPGSSLKPFTYALALMKGYNASSTIIDEPTYFKEKWGDFKPENYDFTFHGKVTLRQALGCSYNVPACKALDSVGVNELFSLLGKMKFETFGRSPSDYGIALTLGSMSASLFELVSGYTVFADRGCQVRPQLIDSYLLEDGRMVRVKNSEEKRIIPEWAAFIIGDILSDNDARYPAFDRENPFKFKYFVGAKTGTSKNYKDNFAVGFTDRYVIGVWAGNNDEEPMVGVSGMTGAGPLFRNAVVTLSKYYRIGKYPLQPDSVSRKSVCSISGLLASEKCVQTHIDWVYDGSASICQLCANDEGRSAGRIKYPDNGDVFVIDSDLDIERQMLEVITEGERKELKVLIDGVIVKDSGEEKRIFFALKKGEHSIELYSDTLLLDRVIFLVE